jgi:type IV pilus assembly protein PilB
VLKRRPSPVAETPAAGPSAEDRAAWWAAEQALGEHLATAGLISRPQLTEALLQLPESGRRLGRLLVELGALDDRDLARELCAISGLPPWDPRKIDPEAGALQLVPDLLAREHAVLPLRLTAVGLEIAVADPYDMAGLSAVAAAAGLGLTMRVAPESTILRGIATAYSSLVDVGGIVQAFEAVESLRRAAAAVAADGSTDPDDAPVIQLVEQILTRALRDRSSDVHIEPQKDRVRVRFRIDGALHDVLALPGSIGPAVSSRIKIMGNLNIADRRRAQDGQMAMTIDGREIDVRISTCPTVWGEKAVLRVLDRTRVVYRLDELGMRDGVHEQFISLVRAPFGMVVCAGPTGSGKTTTLYATLAEVNQTERNVTTIEDPVEYVFPSLTQIQINEASGLTFATGLRAILRQDPDVILVGEVRDAETARIAIESALTGHLVLTSLHATDACAALQRIIDMGVEPFLVASTLTGMASQRLLRRVCEQCRVAHAPRQEDLGFYAQHAAADAPPLAYVYRAEGCESCAHTGYRDRVGAFELVRMTEGIKKVIMTNGTLDDLRAAAQADGSRSLVQEALALVARGATTVDEVMRNLYGG